MTTTDMLFQTSKIFQPSIAKMALQFIMLKMDSVKVSDGVGSMGKLSLAGQAPPAIGDRIPG